MDLAIQRITSSYWRLAATVGATGLIVNLICEALKPHKKVKPEKWANVAQVSKLIIYPVKSCKGVEVDTAEVTSLGLKASKYLRDRAFLVVNSKGDFQNQMKNPRMVLISIQVVEDSLTFFAPGVESFKLNMQEVEGNEPVVCRLWLDQVHALDCGDSIGQWLDNFLNQKGLRLLYHFKDKSQRKLASFAGCVKFPNFSSNDLGAFQDDSAFMLMAKESIVELNKKLKSPVNYEPFRPGILIEGMREAFSEDFWTFIRFRDKETGPILKNSIPCTRCRMTTVIQNKGIFDGEGQPLKTLTTMQRNVGVGIVNELVKKKGVLGVNLGFFLTQGNDATIRVGDPVYVAIL